MYKLSTWVKGSRWQNTEGKVEQLAHAHGLYVETRVVNDFLSKTVYVLVRGSYDSVMNFGRNLINEHRLYKVGIGHFELASRITKVNFTIRNKNED